MSRQNILLFLTDQQSGGMMSCAGNTHVSTPAMDSLAAGGTRFSRCYCTNPVCVPSRFSIFTGMYSSEIGLRADAQKATVSADIQNAALGHTLRSAGYETYYGGKEHFPATSAADLGFDQICTDERDELAESCADFLMNRSEEAPFFLVASLINPHDICYMAIRDYPHSGSSQKLIEKGKVELETLDRTLAEASAIPEQEFWTNRCPPLPDNHQPQADEPEAISDLIDRRPFRRYVRDEWDEKAWRMHRWAYSRLTEHADRQIGTVLDALEVSGLAENTVVIFTSDHGDHDGSHKLEHKTVFYEEACRIPLIIRDPRASKKGVVSSELVCNDIYPTICDYAGATLPKQAVGRSLKGLVRDDEDGWDRDYVIIESEIGLAVRSERYMYAVYDTGRNAEQLYDLDLDPGQTANYADEPGNEAVCTLHRHILNGYLDRRASNTGG